jgi:hypothetical protein
VKQLHCTTCKFTLPVNDSKEAETYKASPPMHCGELMLADGGAPVPVGPTEEAAPKKEEKKGFFGGKKKAKK